MKQDDIHRYLLEVLEKRIPEKTKLADVLMDILFMEKGAVYRRLRGEVPFTFYEVAIIAEKLSISISNFVNTGSAEVERFELNIIEYMNMSGRDYKQWEDYVSLIGNAKSDPHSEIAESSNLLPISIYGKFDFLSKYLLFKYQYLYSGTESRISFGDMVVPERLYHIFRSYFDESKNFSKSIYIWDPMIFQYLVNDIRFFTGTNLISIDDIQQIKKDLFALLDYVEKIALTGCFEETGNAVFFYISDTNLCADYSYVQLNDMYISLVRSFILNSVVSTTRSSYEKMKTWINSLKKSSVLISQSGTVYRAEFFEKQRKMIAEL